MNTRQKRNEANELKSQSKNSNPVNKNQDILEKIEYAFSLAGDSLIMKELKKEVIYHFKRS